MSLLMSWPSGWVEELITMTTTTTERETILYPTKDGRLIPVYADEMAEFEKEFGEYLATEEEWNAAANADLDYQDTMLFWTLEKMTEEEWEKFLGSGPEEFMSAEELGIEEPDDREELFINNESVFAVELRHRIGAGPLAGIFRRDKELVRTPRVGEDGYVEPDNGDDDGPAQVQVLTPAYLAAMVDTRYHVQDLVLDKEETKKAGEKKYRAVEALTPQRPVERAYNAAVMGEDAPHVRNLQGVTHTPVLRRDGTVLSKPGYDPVSRLLYLPNNGLKVPPIPEFPTDEERDQAREKILFLIKDFPFVSEDHRANFVGAMFTPPLKPLAPPPYQFLFITAPNPGSGKGFLAEILGGLHGRVMRGEMPRDAEELRKTITSVLLSTTAPIVCFDNLRGTIKSSVLEGLLTTAEWSDRHLGHNEDISVKNDRFWIATGNNAHLGGDMARRVLVVEIDPKMPNPETRTFDINPRRYVAEHRGELLAAILTIARGWVVAGKPMEMDRTDSFDVWRGTMRGMLKWAGFPGTFGGEDNQIAVVAEDDEEWGEFLAALHDLFGEKEFTAASVWDQLQVHVNNKAAGLDPVKLPEQLSEKYAKGNATTSSSSSFKKSLGKWMSYRVGRYAWGLKLVLAKKGGKKNPSTWTIESTEQ
jgi:hypothetical protein